MRLVGRAHTVLTADVYQRPENPYVKEIAAVDSLKPGDVMVAATNGSERTCLWGELLSTAARARGATGCLIDGHTRDVQRILEMGFPVFCTGFRPVDSSSRSTVIDFGCPVRCGDVLVHPGDIIFADIDGVVVIPEDLSGADRPAGAGESRGRERQPRDAGAGISSARRVRPVSACSRTGEEQQRGVAYRHRYRRHLHRPCRLDDEATFVYGKQASTPDGPARALGAVLRRGRRRRRDGAEHGRRHDGGHQRGAASDGRRVLFVTTAGFEDVPFIGRLDKEELYNLHWRKPAPLVTRRDCYGIAERVGHDGECSAADRETALDDLVAFVACAAVAGEELAVAVCLCSPISLPSMSSAIKRALAGAFPGLPISVSHEVSPTWREYERGEHDDRRCVHQTGPAATTSPGCERRSSGSRASTRRSAC